MLVQSPKVAEEVSGTLPLPPTLPLTLPLPLPLTRYWTRKQPVFMAMHALLTVVAMGIFASYLRTTVSSIVVV